MPRNNTPASEALEGLNRTSGVLLVDDEPNIRRALGRALGAEGYDVIEAGNAAGALAAIDRHGSSIHVLVTDLVMPGMHGDQLAKIVSQRLPNVAVLLISGYFALRGFDSRTWQQDWATLAKPFDLQVFLDVVGTIARRSTANAVPEGESRPFGTGVEDATLARSPNSRLSGK